MFLILLPNTFCLSWNILIFVLGVAWNYKMVTIKGKLNVVHSPALMSVLLNGSSCQMEHIFTDVCERWIGCLEEEPIPGAVDFTLAFSVTEKTWAYSQQLNYFRILYLAPLAVLTGYMFTNHTILDMFFSNSNVS